MYGCLTSLFYSIKPKSTWALLKPHFQTLVSSYVFPQLSFTQTKREQWESDPADYVRGVVGKWNLAAILRTVQAHVQLDEYETFDTPVSAATTFLFSLASNRTKTTFLPILAFVNGVLQS